MVQQAFEGTLIERADNAAAFESPESMRLACEKETVLEHRPFMFDRTRSLVFDFGIMRGIMPFCECADGLDERRSRDVAAVSRVGRPACFIITGFSQRAGETVALLSRRAAQRQYTETALDALAAGDIIPCRITHLARFGAFADIGRGIAALLPLDAVSVSRISDPGERLAAGDVIKCAVRSRDPLGRFTLTLKELLGTWEQNAALFSAGETVSGVVRSVTDYGVFVELAPNLTGLSEPFEGAREGMGASVYIKSILPDRMKIKLAISHLYEREGCPRAPLRYFFDGGHIERFRYSPERCARVIETVF